MRPIFTAIVRNALSRTALFVALAASCAHVSAVGQSDDRTSARESAARQKKDETEGANRPVDPRRIPSWQQLCADNPEKGGCEIILQRLGNKPVIGVLFGPDPGGGVRIAGVTPDGAGAAAGLKSGDRLLRIDGKTIEGDSPDARVENARRMLHGIDANTAVKLRYARGDRETEIAVTPKLDSRIMVFSGDGTMMRPDGNVIIRQLGDGVVDIEADRLDVEGHDRALSPGVGDAPRVFVFRGDGAEGGSHGAPRVDRQVIRIKCEGDREECSKRAEQQVGHGPGRIAIATIGGPHEPQGQGFHFNFDFDCTPGEACAGRQRLAEAFRWNGLNLASVDAQLGRYFGTDKGVLVLSTGAALGQLQAGDVIQRVDGKAVDTPRAVMDALRDKPADSTVAVEYLRDRKSGSAQLKVPRAMVFPSMPPMPPAPPAPPAPPHPPKAGAAPHAPDSTATTTRRKIVMVDKDGQVQTWEDDGNGAMPIPPPAPPAPELSRKRRTHRPARRP